MTIIRRLAVALACWALLVGSAGAETTQAKLEAFQFFGDWSPNCDQPPGPSNTRRHAFVSGSARAMFTESLGPDFRENVYSVLKASRAAADRIELRIELNGAIIQHLSMVKQNDRMRTMINRVRDGTFIVRDGIVLSTGRETPWLSRCADSH